MAQTKSSVHGKQKQKIVTVGEYKRKGKKIKAHKRSTPE